MTSVTFSGKKRKTYKLEHIIPTVKYGDGKLILDVCFSAGGNSQKIWHHEE